MRGAPDQAHVNENLVKVRRVEADRRQPFLINEPDAAQDVVGVSLAEVAEPPRPGLINMLGDAVAPDVGKLGPDGARESCRNKYCPVSQQ
jgi:hypothetical protein